MVNTRRTDETITTTEPSADEMENQLAYVEQQVLDDYLQMTVHMNERKEIFDCHVCKRSPGKVIFKQGDLVQVY